MKDDYIDVVVRILQEEIKSLGIPVVKEVSRGRSPFKVLISCILSLRTKDEVTRDAAKRLFRLAETPVDMLKLDQ